MVGGRANLSYKTVAQRPDAQINVSLIQTDVPKSDLGSRAVGIYSAGARNVHAVNVHICSPIIH